MNALEPRIEKLSDDGLKAKTAEFRTQIDNGANIEGLLHEAFAVVREAGRRAKVSDLLDWRLKDKS